MDAIAIAVVPSDEKMCNEIIYKLQQVTSLLLRSFDSVQSLVTYINANCSIGLCSSASTTGLSMDATFSVNIHLLKNTLHSFSQSLQCIADSLMTDIHPELLSDVESNALSYSDRLCLLHYVKDYDTLHDITAAYVLRYLPSLIPFLDAISNSMLANISIDTFTSTSKECASVLLNNGTDNKLLLKQVDSILVHHVPDAIQFTSYVSQTLLIIDHMTVT